MCKLVVKCAWNSINSHRGCWKQVKWKSGKQRKKIVQIGQEATPGKRNEKETNLGVPKGQNCQVKKGVTLGIWFIPPYK